MFWETVESKESDNQSFFSISQSFRNTQGIDQILPIFNPKRLQLEEIQEMPTPDTAQFFS